MRRYVRTLLRLGRRRHAPAPLHRPEAQRRDQVTVLLLAADARQAERAVVAFAHVASVQPFARLAVEQCRHDDRIRNHAARFGVEHRLQFVAAEAIPDALQSCAVVLTGDPSATPCAPATPLLRLDTPATPEALATAIVRSLRAGAASAEEAVALAGVG
jgi:hypothetical protein